MSQEQETQQIEAWVERLDDIGLTPIIIPLLELARPLGFLIGQLILLGEPLLIGANGHSSLRETVEWLEDSSHMDQLLARLTDE